MKHKVVYKTSIFPASEKEVFERLKVLKTLQYIENTTQYTDEVEINAGWKTIFVYMWANAFYAHRQRKWKRLLSNNNAK